MCHILCRMGTYSPGCAAQNPSCVPTHEGVLALTARRRLLRGKGPYFHLEIFPFFGHFGVFWGIWAPFGSPEIPKIIRPWPRSCPGWWPHGHVPKGQGPCPPGPCRPMYWALHRSRECTCTASCCCCLLFAGVMRGEPKEDNPPIRSTPKGPPIKGLCPILRICVLHSHQSHGTTLRLSTHTPTYAPIVPHRSWLRAWQATGGSGSKPLSSPLTRDCSPRTCRQARCRIPCCRAG